MSDRKSPNNSPRSRSNSEARDLHDMNENLYSAAERGDVVSVQHFVQAGANKEHCNSLGWTPLLVASFYGHNDVVAYLLSVHANFHHVDKFNETALFKACKNQKVSTAEMLILQGSDITVVGSGFFYGTALSMLDSAVDRERLQDLAEVIGAKSMAQAMAVIPFPKPLISTTPEEQSMNRLLARLNYANETIRNLTHTIDQLDRRVQRQEISLSAANARAETLAKMNHILMERIAALTDSNYDQLPKKMMTEHEEVAAR